MHWFLLGLFMMIGAFVHLRQGRSADALQWMQLGLICIVGWKVDSVQWKQEKKD